MKNVPIVYSKDLADSFFADWIDSFEALGMDPLDPLRAAMNESGLYANAHNPSGDAVGLIQFMPPTLEGLGFKGGWQEFQKLSATAQVPYVKAYYAPHAKDCTTAALCYVTTFLPALLSEAKASGMSYVLAEKGGKLGWAYDANPGFDADNKGSITVQDLENAITAKTQGARWNEILNRYHTMFTTRGFARHTHLHAFYQTHKTGLVFAAIGISFGLLAGALRARNSGKR